MSSREVQTCARCRNSKRRCDKLKPACTRCLQAGLPCAYEPPSQASLGAVDGLLTPDSSSRSSPSENNPSSTKIVRKRDRATLSCVRCHRLKVKCDQKHPICSRCARLGHGRECVYTHRVQKPTISSSLGMAGSEDPETTLALWFLRKRGSTRR